MKNFILVGIASFIFVGCAGSGFKTYGEYISATESSTYSDVIVYRPSGFVGGGTIFTVTLNGIELGKLGSKEFLIGEMQEGRNSLEVKVGGLQGLGINKPSQTFEKTTDGNTYFKVSYTYDSINSLGPVNLKIVIQEISLNQFRALAAS